MNFDEIFYLQKSNQQSMLNRGMYDEFKSSTTTQLPVDDVKLMSYHIQQLMSEIGEVLDADKRWKNFRNDKYDKAAKLEEIADCFIVLMNIAIFSGFDADSISSAILNKVLNVAKRIEDIK